MRRTASVLGLPQEAFTRHKRLSCLAGYFLTLQCDTNANWLGHSLKLVFPDHLTWITELFTCYCSRDDKSTMELRRLFYTFYMSFKQNLSLMVQSDCTGN